MLLLLLFFFLVLSVLFKRLLSVSRVRMLLQEDADGAIREVVINVREV